MTFLSSFITRKACWGCYGQPYWTYSVEFCTKSNDFDAGHLVRNIYTLTEAHNLEPVTPVLGLSNNILYTDQLFIEGFLNTIWLVQCTYMYERLFSIPWEIISHERPVISWKSLVSRETQSKNNPMCKNIVPQIQ